MRVLLICESGSNLARQLQSEGISAVSAQSGEDGLSQAAHVDVVMIGDMPDMADLEIVSALLKRSCGACLVGFGSKPKERRVELLRAGAAAYLLKPLHADELAASLRALHRVRMECLVSAAHPQVVEVGKLRFDMNEQELQAAGKSIPLKGDRRAVMRTFFAHPHRRFSREELRELALGPYASAGAVDYIIRDLRFKIDAAGLEGTEYIRVCAEGGWKLAEPEDAGVMRLGPSSLTLFKKPPR